MAGLNDWLPDEFPPERSPKPYFGTDRTLETRFDRPSWKNYIQPIWENIVQWKQAQQEPDMYYAPSTRPWRNIKLRLLRRNVAHRKQRWSKS